MRPPEHVVCDAVVAFGRGLRAAGVPTGIDEELVLSRALGEVDAASRREVYWACRATLLRRRDDVETFDRLFDRFWEGLSLDSSGAAVAEHGESDPRMAGPQHGGESLPAFRPEGRSGHLLDGRAQPALRPLEVPTAANEEPGEGRRQGVLAAYSPEEVLSERDRLDYERRELLAVRRLADALRQAAPLRRSRRVRPGRRHGAVDLRRPLRASLATDAEPLRLTHSAHSLRPRRLLFVCDVSGSMERYSRALLASLRALVGAGIRAETFVFATRLTRLTGDLSGHNVAQALERAREAVPDWSGGTRIGRALEDFNHTYARLGLARGAIVVVVSDGWDRGDPELLARELDRLRLQCSRLVWLNPRAGSLDGQPLAVGMQVALPFVDDFVPGHDPRVITEVVRLLQRLGSSRPMRAQRPRGR